MKQFFFFLTAIIGLQSISYAQNVGIGTTTPDASAILDISATNKGVLVPQVSLTSLTAAAPTTNPATGLLVYNINTTLGVGYYYNAGTPASPRWVQLLSSASPLNAWSINGNEGNTFSNFIGTTDTVPLRFRVNNAPAGIVDINLDNTALGGGTFGAGTNVGNTLCAFGTGALYSNTSGGYDVSIGPAAMEHNTTGSHNTATGANSLQYNVGGAYNTAYGDQSLFSNTGSGNTAYGSSSLQSNTIGYNNVAIGTAALFSSTSDLGTVAIGDSALYTLNFNRSASGFSGDIAIGYLALQKETGTGFGGNVAIGYDALFTNTTGNDNTAIGLGDLLYNTTGSSNTVIGAASGFGITSGSNNILIGASLSVPSGTASNQLNIGNWIYGNNGVIGIGTGSNATNPTRAQLVVDGSITTNNGNFAFYSLSGTTPFTGGNTGAVNTSIWASGRMVASEFDATSDMRIKRDIKPLPDNSLNTLAKINVVSYTKLSKEGYASEIGVLGQKVEKILPGAVKQSEGDVYNDSTKKWEVVKDFRTVNYQTINMLTTKAVQELNQKADDQQTTISNQQKEIDALQKEVEELKALMKK